MWPVSLSAHQQFFFQPSPARPELLDLRLESIEELASKASRSLMTLQYSLQSASKLASLVINWRTVSSSSENLANNDRMRSTTPLVSIFKA